MPIALEGAATDYEQWDKTTLTMNYCWPGNDAKRNTVYVMYNDKTNMYAYHPK